MKLTLETQLLDKYDYPNWKHGDSIVQLGSCFSTNMTEWFRLAGFEVFDNPFGVIFHPLVLADQLKLALGKGEFKPLLQRKDIWLSYDAGSKIYGKSSDEVEKLRNAQVEALRTALETAKTLFVTFGSAHGYSLPDYNRVVANCHQVPGNQFTKKLFSATEMEDYWIPVLELLRENYPQLQVVFTVSPVRYTRDGLVENNRSKANLLELAHRLCERFDAFYFPSYELVIDILRDYRFYDRDLVHPNALAVEEVWNLCYEHCFSAETKAIVEELLKLRQQESHRLLFPDSENSRDFKSEFLRKKASFLSRNPEVVW